MEAATVEPGIRLDPGRVQGTSGEGAGDNLPWGGIRTFSGSPMGEVAPPWTLEGAEAGSELPSEVFLG